MYCFVLKVNYQAVYYLKVQQNVKPLKMCVMIGELCSVVCWWLL